MKKFLTKFLLLLLLIVGGSLQQAWGQKDVTEFRLMGGQKKENPKNTTWDVNTIINFADSKHYPEGGKAAFTATSSNDDVVSASVLSFGYVNNETRARLAIRLTSANTPGKATITVTFKGNSEYNTASFSFDVVCLGEHTLVFWDMPGGTMTAKVGEKVLTSGQSVTENAQVTFTATPYTHYEFDHWQNGNGETLSTANPYTISMPASYYNISPVFKLKTYTISFDGNGNGGGNVPAPVQQEALSWYGVPDNTGKLTLMNKIFQGWKMGPSGTTVYSPTNGNAGFTVESDVTLYAVWGDLNYQHGLTYTVPSGYGTLSAKKGNDAFASGTTVKMGDVIKFTAIPNTGYVLDYVEVTNGSRTFRQYRQNEFTFIVPNGDANNSIQVKAYFVQPRQEATTISVENITMYSLGDKVVPLNSNSLGEFGQWKQIATKNYSDYDKNLWRSGFEDENASKRTFEASNGVLTIENTEKAKYNWDVQYHIINGLPLKKDVQYQVRVTLDASTSGGTMALGLGTWGDGARHDKYGLALPTQKQEICVDFTAKVDANNDAFVIMQTGDFVGTIHVYKVEVYEKVEPVSDIVTMIMDDKQLTLTPKGAGNTSLTLRQEASHEEHLSIEHFWLYDEKGPFNENAVKKEVRPQACAFVLNEVSSMPYGWANVSPGLFADLSAYDRFVLTVREGTPRFLFNRDVENGTAPDHMIAIPDNADQTNAYQTVVDNGDGTKNYIINLKKMVADKGYAHLHAIKGAGWGNVLVTEMMLYGANPTAYTLKTKSAAEKTVNVTVTEDKKEPDTKVEGTDVDYVFGGWRYNSNTNNHFDSWTRTNQDFSTVDNQVNPYVGVNWALGEASTDKIQSFDAQDPYTIPVRGSYMTFYPKKDGNLSVYVLQYANQAYRIVDEMGRDVQNVLATSSPDASSQNGAWSVSADCIVKYTFPVSAGEAYTIFCNSSAMGFASCTMEDAVSPTGSLALVDTEAFNVASKTSYANISVNRSFTAGQWSTIVLPFYMSESEVASVFGEGTLLEALHEASVEESTLTLGFILHVNQAILPGYPYFIKPTRDVTSINVTNKTIDPTITQTEIVKGDYTFKGVDGYCDPKSEGDYNGSCVLLKRGDLYMSGGTLKLSGGMTRVKGYRSYIECAGDATPTNVKVQTISVFDEDDTTETSILNIPFSIEPTAAQRNAEGIYNLSGQKMSEDVQLHKGIYISNGKKVLVK